MAKHNSIPAPQIPSLDPDGNGFITWRRDIYLWVSVTKVPANQRATHIYLSFKEGKAKKQQHKSLKETYKVLKV